MFGTNTHEPQKHCCHHVLTNDNTKHFVNTNERLQLASEHMYTPETWDVCMPDVLFRHRMKVDWKNEWQREDSPKSYNRIIQRMNLCRKTCWKRPTPKNMSRHEREVRDARSMSRYVWASTPTAQYTALWYVQSPEESCLPPWPQVGKGKCWISHTNQLFGKRITNREKETTEQVAFEKIHVCVAQPWPPGHGDARPITRYARENSGII